MQTVTTIGLDIAKSVLQVHGVDAAGQVVKRLIVPHLLQTTRFSVIRFYLRHAGCAITSSAA
jgi:hypothetical protein